MRTPDPIISSGDLNLQNNGTQSISPQKSLDQAPPGSEIRHYKGELGYGNYGYLLINNTWVDPDSEGEVTKALRDELLRTSIPHIPIVSDGAKIMTPEEQDKFYREYTRDVSLSVSGDLEGDPRFLRISPATFTRWAEGASKGDSYITTEVPNPVSLVSSIKASCPLRFCFRNIWLICYRSHWFASHVVIVVTFLASSIGFRLSRNMIWIQGP